MRSDWKNAHDIDENAGIVCILKDKDTGELLKVGKTTGKKFRGRFRPYATAGTKTKRNLELDVYAFDTNQLGSPFEVERDIRKNLIETNLEELPWDSTDMRLGRPGSGIPGQPTKNGRRGNHSWVIDSEEYSY